jgi:DNA-directed RNA polymerase specialized sigma24 family protein
LKTARTICSSGANQEAEFMNLLNQLPLPQRSVLLLHFVEDFSLEEIARITETQLGTVKSRCTTPKNP